MMDTVPFEARACNLCGGRSAQIRFEIAGYHIVRCDRCELQFVGETVSAAELESYYGPSYYSGRQPQGYDDYLGRGEARKAHFRSFIPALRRHAVPDSAKVLDVGCAAGFFLEVVREQGWLPVGVDLSTYASDYARSELGLDVRTGTLADVALPDESFDLVTLWDVLEHLPDPAEVVGRAHRLLRPGGLLVVSTGDVCGATARIYGKRWALFAPPGHLFYFSRRTLWALLKKAGFEILEWQSDGAFLLNDAESEASIWGARLARVHRVRWVNAMLRRLKLGSIITVFARRSCGDR